jgi:hypothetical protein
VALVLGGLLGQDVTLEGLTALDGATWTNAKTLLRAALGFHFGHVTCSFLNVLVRRLQKHICSLDGPEPLLDLGASNCLLHPSNWSSARPAQLLFVWADACPNSAPMLWVLLELHEKPRSSSKPHQRET